MKTILEILRASELYLREKKISAPRRQAEAVIADALGCKRLDLYMQFDRPLNAEELNLAREAICRRASHEPPAYISGEMDFAGVHLKVSSAAIIPRPETEILVEKIAHEIGEEGILLDLCCGGGCMGIALKKRFPKLTVLLSDICSDALALAQENARSNGVEVHFFQGDLFEPIAQPFDYLVCNPPYIGESEFERLDPEVRDFEPRKAHVAGSTGLEFYQKIASQLPVCKAWFELGATQGKAVQSIFERGGCTKMRIEADFAGQDRFFFLEKEAIL